MNTNIRRMNLSASVLLLLAGAGAVAVAQAGDPRTPPAESADLRAWSPDFHSCHALLGSDVMNTEGKEIAKITDVVMDRGSGRAEYVVLRTGDILGLGGKTVAVPYASLHWKGVEPSTARLDSTAEALKQYPSFTAEEWSAMMESRQSENGVLYDRFIPPAATDSLDPYHASLKDSTKVKLSGTVQSVERVPTSSYGEQVLVTISTADGATRRIALGPSWYLGGSAVYIARGDSVEIDALDMPRDNLLTAMSIRINGRDVQLREQSGNAMWALRPAKQGDRGHGASMWRYALLSNIRGMPVECRGAECGKVNDVVIERNSGQVGFLSIDPNQNFLGIADTKRLVPWSVATVSLDGKIRIDASKEMVVASPETPSDLSTLNQRTSFGRVYDSYKVPAYRFEPLGHVAPSPPLTRNAWSADGPIIGAIEPGTNRTIAGEVVGFSKQPFDGGVDTASTVKIRTNDASEVVLLGPDWYMERQTLAFKQGDQVTLDVSRTTINGKPYWIARSVANKSSRLVLWNDEKPIWNER